MDSPGTAQGTGSSAQAGGKVIGSSSYRPPWVWADSPCLRRRRLGNLNTILERRGVLRVTTFPARARSKFGDDRLGEVRSTADIQVEIEGSRGGLTAFALEA